MSEADTGGFLARWSRRKAAIRDSPAPEQPQAAEAPVAELPPIESLGADSDYTVFLARGVSRMVQAQALRVAWASDPVIANFRGMAEYAWDFNAPGYGDLAPGDDAAAWLRQIVHSGVKRVTDVVTDGPPAQAPDGAAEAPLDATAAVRAPALMAPEPVVPVAAIKPLAASDASEAAVQLADASVPSADVPATVTPVAPAVTSRQHGAEIPVNSHRHGGDMPVYSHRHGGDMPVTARRHGGAMPV